MLWLIKFCAYETVTFYNRNNIETSDLFLKHTQINIDKLISLNKSISLNDEPEVYNLTKSLFYTNELISSAIDKNDGQILIHILNVTLNDEISDFLKYYYEKYPENKKDFDIIDSSFTTDPYDNIIFKSVPIIQNILELRGKIKNNDYKKELVPCCCGSVEFTVLRLQGNIDLNEQHCICKNCGLVLINPRLKDEYYNLFYEKYYRKIYKAYQPVSEYYDEEIDLGNSILSFCKNFIKKEAKILEIGCGAGGIVSAFKEHGFNASGIDIGSEFIKFGQSKGLELYNSNSQDFLKSTKNKYDFIILNHVLEHFLDIKKEISTIKELLSEEGILFIGVPGIRQLIDNGYDINKHFHMAHTYYFNLSTLNNVMKLNNFEMIVGMDNILALYKYNPKLNNELENNYYEILNYYKFITNIKKLIKNN